MPDYCGHFRMHTAVNCVCAPVAPHRSLIFQCYYERVHTYRKSKLTSIEHFVKSKPSLEYCVIFEARSETYLHLQGTMSYQSFGRIGKLFRAICACVCSLFCKRNSTHSPKTKGLTKKMTQSWQSGDEWPKVFKLRIFFPFHFIRLFCISVECSRVGFLQPNINVD